MKPAIIASAISLLVPCLAVAEDAAGLSPPEVVRLERVRTEDESQVIVVGNQNGHYTLSCNIKAGGCKTPSPGHDYYVFNENTRWRMPGAKTDISLSFIQDWTVTYAKAKNIGLVSKDKDDEFGLGVYILESWTTDGAHR